MGLRFRVAGFEKLYREQINIEDPIAILGLGAFLQQNTLRANWAQTTKTLLHVGCFVSSTFHEAVAGVEPSTSWS